MKGDGEMGNIIINGGKRLEGELSVQGSKNSSLPILAATVLVDGVSIIHNCPTLSDVDAAVRILRHLGCKVKRENDTLTVDSRNITCSSIPEKLMREMRSSIVFLGSILGRTGKAQMSSPGGCEIGLRPIDLHLKALKRLGAEINESCGCICCKRVKNEGAVISLSFPSVGATENIILASALSKGRTVIHNAAREPEIIDLARFLNKAGCRIKIRKDTVVIDGVEKACSPEHRVMSDRIAALTYMSAVGAAGGDVLLKDTDTSAFFTVLPVFEGAGCLLECTDNTVRIKMNRRPSGVRDIRTLPYPGFPTDAQAPVMAMLSFAKGTSLIVENIFENRFKHVTELCRMGAQIKIEGRVAIIDGRERLYGAKVKCTDLRGGGALVVAGLGAKGTTVISSLSHIDRGYEKIEENFRNLGADIFRL